MDNSTKPDGSEDSWLMMILGAVIGFAGYLKLIKSIHKRPENAKAHLIERPRDIATSNEPTLSDDKTPEKTPGTRYPIFSKWTRGEVVNLVLTIVTALYVAFTYQLLSTAQKQLELSQEPALAVSPGRRVEGDVGRFTLTLANVGVVNVKNVEIYEDYFVALKAPDSPVALYRFGFVNTNPDTTIPKLDSGERADFNIEFNDVYPQMVDFYNSDIKGGRMRVARLELHYSRQLDGREFVVSKVYIIAGHGDMLFDDSARLLDVGTPAEFNDVSLNEIKQILNAR